MNTSNNNIAAVSASSDFTTLAAGTYCIYGASYKSGGATPPAIVNPAGWVNANLQTVQGSDCMVLSSNCKPLTVIPFICSITQIATSNISTCSYSAPNSTFTADVTVTFANPPATGNLVLSGDGSATVAVGSLMGTTHTFTGVSMTADGGAINLTATFSDQTPCTFTNANAGTAPAACPPMCSISNITTANISACSYAAPNSTFTADVTVTFANPPATGNLVLSGDGSATVAVGSLMGTTHTFTSVSMTADGGAINLTATFSDQTPCTFTNANAGTAPAACPPMCSISNITTANISACSYAAPNSTFTADVTVTFANPPASGNLVLSGDGSASVAVASLMGMTHTFTGMSMTADGGAINLTATFSDQTPCTFTNANAGTAPAACPPPCSISMPGLLIQPTCQTSGDVTFFLNFVVTSGSGNYNIINTGNNMIIGSISGGTMNGVQNILGTVSGPVVAHTITVKIEDANNTACMSPTRDVDIPTCPPCDLKIGNVTNTSPTCPGATDGTITISASTSHPPVSYSISGPSSATNATGMFTGLAAGMYGVTVTDAVGGTCEDNESTTIAPGTDSTPPTINCPSDISKTLPQGQCDDTATWAAPSTSDNCSAVNVVGSHNSGDTFQPGTTTVTYTATDASNNSATCTFKVTLNFGSNPMISNCPSNVNVNTTLGQCDGMATWSNPFVINGCPGTTLVGSHNSGATFPIGSTTVIYTATDVLGNTGICSFNVTVNDMEPPVISGCPSNMTVNNTPGQCNGIATWTNPTASDNCPGATIVGSHTSGSNFSIGNTTVTYTATDATGNNSTCTFVVTVNDNEPIAIANCPADIMQDVSPGQPSTSVSWTLPTASDNCPGASISGSHNPGDQFFIGITIVTYTASDANGNTATCTFNVIVNDPSGPLGIVCPGDVTISCSDTTDPSNTGTAMSTGSCPSCNIIFTDTDNQGNTGCAQFNYTITRTWTAIDFFNNSATCIQTITVQDMTPPAFDASLPPITDTMMVTTATGTCEAMVNLDLSALITDNCTAFGDLTITNSQTTGGADASGILTPGLYNITFSATDICGNSSSYTRVVRVNDGGAPMISCLNPLIIEIPSNGILPVTEALVLDATSDDCTPNPIITIFPDTLDCGDADGSTMHMITLTATDNAGNSATCTTTIVLEDNTAPAAQCENIIIFLDQNGMASITVNDIDDGSLDDCSGINTITISQSNFNTSHIGPNNITLTVTDVAGNTSSCTAVVEVSDGTNTCFNIGDDIGFSGEMIQIPVTVTNFSNVSGFEVALEMMTTGVGVFKGIAGVTGSLSGSINVQLLADTTINGMDTLIQNNGIYLSRMGGAPVTLNDNTVAFSLNIQLTGNLNQASPIGLQPNNIPVSPEVTYTINNTPVTTTLCTSPGSIGIDGLIIAGEIYNESGQNIGKADVDLLDDGTFPSTLVASQQTSGDGQFSFILTTQSDYSLHVEKLINWPNGIDILDVAAIQQHAIGNQYLSSAYKKIAADVTDDGLITTFDAVFLNSFLNSGFTINQPANKSWRFVDAAQMLANNQNSIVPPFNEVQNFPALASGVLASDFVGVKIGDVAGISANPALLVGEDGDTRTSEILQFIVEDQSIIKDELFQIPVRAKNFINQIGYQCVLEFDREILAFQWIESGLLTLSNETNVGRAFEEEGKIILTWYNAQPITAGENDILFYLQFEGLSNAKQLSPLLQITSLTQVPAVAYNSLHTPFEIELLFENDKLEQVENFALFANRPNPFSKETTIGFNLPEGQNATLTIYDVSGRLLWEYSGDFGKGYNEIVVDQANLNQTGLMYYQLNTDKNMATKRMMVLKRSF